MTTYGIHDFLTIRTNTSIPVPDYFAGEGAKGEHELSMQETTAFDYEPPAHARRLASHHFWYDDRTLTVSYPTMPTGKPVALQLSDLEYPRTVVKYTPAFREMVDFSSLFEGLLTAKLLEADVALIHAGGLVRNDEATLLTSMGRMGKTSTVLSILSEHEDIGFMGDNVLLIDASGSAYAWPATLGVFPGTTVGDAQLPDTTKLRVQLKRLIAKSDLLVALLLHKFSVDLSEDVDPAAVGTITADSSIERVYVLNGGRLNTGKHELSPSAAAAKVATGTDMELDPQDYYLSLYAFAGDNPSVHPDRVKQRRAALIETALSESTLIELFANDVSGYTDRVEL